MSEDLYVNEEKIRGFTTKKCPECFEYLPLKARKCPVCRSRVGDVDKRGFASRPFDWWGYLMAVGSILAFWVYVWWAFFRASA
ncbi:MAG: hypothetical protein JSW39_05570 [Desulfobacterales bacterium]|nr:MAG: hypothetical protein JSW39_05570 [Desulfobacterales bacterium]